MAENKILIMLVNKARFYNLSYEINREEHQRFNIGTYKEKRMHLVLKNYYDDDPAVQEVKVGSYVADILNDKGIIEIQTSSFGSMRGKLEAFLPQYEVTVVHPIPAVKWLSWIDPETGEIGQRRKSPLKGSAVDLLYELIYIRDFLKTPGLRFHAVLLEVEEYRYRDGYGKGKRRRSHRYERIPIDLVDIVEIACKQDYLKLFPDLPETFGIQDFALLSKLRYRDAQTIIKVLIAAGVVEEIGKNGRRKVFRVCEDI